MALERCTRLQLTGRNLQAPSPSWKLKPNASPILATSSSAENRRFKSSAVEWCAHFRTRLENCVSRWAIKLANGRGAATLLPLNQRIWFWPAFRRRGWVVHAINPMIVRQNQEVMGFISQPIYQCTSGKLEENMFSLSGYPHWLLFCSIFIITFLVSQYFSIFFIWVERWITCKVVIMDKHCFEVFKCLWNLSFFLTNLP